MFVHQAIQRPFGVNVFGSCVVRVKPDYATLAFAVTRTAEKPADAFAQTRKAADEIRSFLASSDVAGNDVQSSRATLRQAMRGYGDKLEYIGYQAKASFVVHLRDLDRLEQMLSGVVEAGADVIDAVDLRTSRLAELRAQARTRAIQAARKKAEGFAAAATISLGHVMHIEDVNPDDLKSRRGHGADLDLTDDETASDAQAYDPGAIEIAAAVMVAFQIDRDKPFNAGF
jgi:uncharacterized protein YggE